MPARKNDDDCEGDGASRHGLLPPAQTCMKTESVLDECKGARAAPCSLDVSGRYEQTQDVSGLRHVIPIKEYNYLSRGRPIKLHGRYRYGPADFARLAEGVRGKMRGPRIGRNELWRQRTIFHAREFVSVACHEWRGGGRPIRHAGTAGERSEGRGEVPDRRAAQASGAAGRASELGSDVRPLRRSQQVRGAQGTLRR